MARQPDQPVADWAPCPPGKIVHLGQKLRKQRQRRVFLRTATMLTGAAAIGAGTWLSWTMLGREPNYGGVTCSEVQRLGADYAKGNLDEAVKNLVRQHLARCPKCAAKYRSMGLPT